VTDDSGGLIAVDNMRRSDLSVTGWLGVGIAGIGLSYAVWTVAESAVLGGSITSGLIAGTAATLIGGAVAYLSAAPEMECICDECGERVIAHSGRDGHDEFIEAHSSTDPRRGRFGPISVILQRRTADFHYCSGYCAAKHAPKREMTIEPTADNTIELPADNAGTDDDGTAQQGSPQPATGD
jgi:hypothetical protein